MTFEKVPQKQYCNQPGIITEEELIRFIKSGFITIDEMISDAGMNLNQMEAAYLKKTFSKYKTTDEDNRFEKRSASKRMERRL